MLYITYLNGRGILQDHQWHLDRNIESGLPIPTKIPITIMREAVTHIQADGHELDWILSNFKNVPTHCTAKVQTWTGSIARFIFQHLTYQEKIKYKP